ncbi:hypothetical protein [Caulobacter flavus]|nr:hypothetical protein [Caulobacter flavus]
MTALAAMLVAVFVVQGPMTSLDRALHGPPGAVAALDEDHDHVFQGRLTSIDVHFDASIIEADDPVAPHHHHHHHDTPSVFGSLEDLPRPAARHVDERLWALAQQRLTGIGGPQQERPPKEALAHVA